MRDVERQRLGSDGRPVEVVQLRFRVEPRGEAFDETLLAIDGRAPTPREVAQHRRAGRFAEHYRGVLTGRGEDVDEGYALADRYPRQERAYGFLLAMQLTDDDVEQPPSL